MLGSQAIKALKESDVKSVFACDCGDMLMMC